MIRLGSQSLAQPGKYVLFSKPLQNGAALYVVGEGVPWTNNLAVDGSFSLSSIPLSYTWTGAVDGTNLVNPGNFTVDGIHPNTNLPSGLDGTGIPESAIWNGLTTSNLILTYGGTGWPNTLLGTVGVNLITTTNQTNSVQIIAPPVRSPGMGFAAFTNNSPSAAIVLGDGTTNDLLFTARPTAAIHHFVNNSTAACIINPNIEWQAGGGWGYTYDFGGPEIGWLIVTWCRTMAPSSLQ
jgi:hypothetical protein